jgi:glycosyltransferase involved in cell wall biosynthesis
MTKDPSVNVTVIVTSRNSARTIGRCLGSILSQSIPVEVLVVDNFSSDATVEIASGLRCKVVVAGHERSRQRNIGARIARTTWILFADADMLLHSNVVASCLRVCVAERASAAVIPQLAVGEGFLARARALEKKCYVGDSYLEAPRFFQRHVFNELGGYDEELCAAEDWDLSSRARTAGVEIARAEYEIVHLDGRIRIVETVRKFRYYAPSIARYRKKHHDHARHQFRPFRSALMRNWKTLLLRPHLATGIGMLKAAELTGIVLGTLDRKVNRHACYVEPRGE